MELLQQHRGDFLGILLLSVSLTVWQEAGRKTEKRNEMLVARGEPVCHMCLWVSLISLNIISSIFLQVMAKMTKVMSF